MTDTSERFGRAPGLLVRALPREVLLAAEGDREIESLSGTALEVWNLLGEPRTTREIVEVLRDRYRVSDADIHGDVAGLLDELRSRGLVESLGESDA